MRLDIYLGRTAAMCVHPYAAWRTSAGGTRLVLLAAYMAIGYTVALAALVLL